MLCSALLIRLKNPISSHIKCSSFVCNLLLQIQFSYIILFMELEWLYCRTLIKSRPIRPLWGSTFSTRTSTRSPGPRARLRRLWLTGNLSRVMLLLCMRPERPTPISTKAPNSVVLSTRPVSTAPTRRSLIDTIPCLKSACPKSEDSNKKETTSRENINKMKWLDVMRGKSSMTKSGMGVSQHK